MGTADYESLMHLVLRFAGDEKEHTVAEAYKYVGEQLGLSEEELSCRLPDSHHTIVGSRVWWAVSQLKKSRILCTTKRGHFKITQRGVVFLNSKPAEVNDKTLSEITGIAECKSGMNDEPLKETPEEAIGTAFWAINAKLKDDLLRRIREGKPNFFEQLVVDLLTKIGYGGSRGGAAAAIGGKGDEGIDGIIEEDVLGLDAIYVQAKRWESGVGRPEIQKFAGALQGRKAKKGIFITTSWFTKDAAEYASSIDCKIVLIDGQKLTELMVENNVGVSTINNYSVKKVDMEYFKALSA